MQIFKYSCSRNLLQYLVTSGYNMKLNTKAQYKDFEKFKDNRNVKNILYVCVHMRSG